MAQKARTDQLDSARRKRKEDLEAKESAAKRSRMDADERAINLEKIDRLRKENLQKLDEAMGVPSASKAAKDEKQSFVNPNIPMTEKKEGILVVKPRKGYSPTEDEVRSIFFKYGEFTLVSTKKSFLMAFPDESILIRILRDSTNPILSKFKIMAQEEKIPDIDQPLPKPNP
ncbi:hypothetical protein BC829DRAFT_15211 [Chytridium lagenaria]|nr:hypothetical protein BC829DRAFT_15211 [Chytridium lagenaria]